MDRAVHFTEHSLSTWRFLAPAGAPIAVSDLGRWAAFALAPRRGGDVLVDAVRERFGVSHCRLTSTGRAGLTLLLKALRRLAPAARDEVAIPSYTCYSVAASIVKAGLRPRLVDVDPTSLDLSPSALRTFDSARTLAVIGTNLYGLPNDMPELSGWARERGVFLIDDAAQAMGATIAGRPCGTWGDAGLFSLDKGKNVAAIDGGILVTSSDDIARALDQELAGLPSPGTFDSAVHVAKALVYFALLRPWLYAVPARLPQLGLGRTVFTTDYPLANADPALMALAAVMVRRLDAFTSARQARADALRSALASIPGVTMVEPRSGSVPAYLRLPVLLPDASRKAEAIRTLVADGVGATGSYPECLADVPELQPHLAGGAAVDGGRAVARRLVTLPTHPFVTQADVARIAGLLERGLITACAA